MVELGRLLRSLYKRPAQSLLIISIIAIGIGMGCAFYSIGEDLLLRPLPFDQDGRLMDVEQVLEPSGSRFMNSEENLEDLGQESRTLNGVAVYQGARGTIEVKGSREYAEGMRVDVHFFPLLGVTPALGRGFTVEDEQYGAPSTVILSYAYWQRRFRGSRGILGQQVLFDKRPYVVIGVTPQLFYFPFLELTEEDFWLPLQQSPAARRGNYDKWGIARIKAGTTVDQAQAEVTQLAIEMRRANPQKSFSLYLRSYRETVFKGLRPLLFILAGLIICIQLVVCINVASLLLVEAMRCRKEVEIRFALGGTRWKIARLFLLRALALALAGGAAGASLAYGLVYLTRRLLPAGFPGAHQITLNATLLWLTLLVSLGTGLFFGLWPALAATKKLHKISLNQASQRSATGRSTQHSRRSLVALQLAFSSAFLVVTVLLGASFYQLLDVDLGFHLDHRLIVSVAASDTGLKTEEAKEQFYWNIRGELQALPGVDAVTVSSDAPLTGHGQRDFRIKDAPAPKDLREWMANEETIGANYFQLLGILVRRGRAFNEGDTKGGAPVVIVNEAFARHFWGDISPLGKQICIPTEECLWREIVGIVSDARESRIDSRAEPTYYVPFWQAQAGFLGNATFILHTRMAVAPVLKAVGSQIRKWAPGAIPLGPITLEEMRSRQLMGSRYRLGFLATIAILALSLAAMGVYGVVAGDVEQRRREIGIRMALGASPKHIALLFQRQMLFMLIPGLLLGLGLAIVLVRYTTSILFGISSVNPVAYSTAALILSALAVASTALPVWRALHKPTADILRTE